MPHEYDDDQDRPPPFNNVLVQEQNVDATGGYSAPLADTDVTGYRSTAVQVVPDGSDVTVRVTWYFSDGASGVTTWEEKTVLDGAPSTLLFINQGDTLSDVTLTGGGGSTDYGVIESNQLPLASAGDTLWDVARAEGHATLTSGVVTELLANDLFSQTFNTPPRVDRFGKTAVTPGAFRMDMMYLSTYSFMLIAHWSPGFAADHYVEVTWPFGGTWTTAPRVRGNTTPGEDVQVVSGSFSQGSLATPVGLKVNAFQASGVNKFVEYLLYAWAF